MGFNRLSRRSRGVALILAFIALSACLGGARRGVGVKQLGADLIFGIPPLEESVAPPDTIPFEDVEIRDTGSDSFRTRPIPPGIGSSFTCPEADVNEVPDEADVRVPGTLPAQGKYRWLRRGDQAIPGVSERLPVSNRDERSITDVRALQARGDYEYKMTQQNLERSATWVLTFQVITSRPDPPTNVNVVREQGTVNGIFLVRWSKTFADQRTATFTPNPPILYLPLPVRVGFKLEEQVGVDPTTLDSFQHNLTVVERRRVDACGTLVDGWFVDGEQIFSGASETWQRDFNYIVATQKGGIIVFEHVETPCTAYDAKAEACVPTGNIRYDTRITQTDPSPL